MIAVPDNDSIDEAYEQWQERRIRRRKRLLWEETEHNINLENEEN